MEQYIPPFDITEEMVGLTSDIMELLGQMNSVQNLDKLPRLRRVNRIKSIHSSLAIENNTLSLEQVTDVIDGKRVIAPKDDILAVKNAHSIYALLPKLNPYSISDLLKAHAIMMKDLVESAGHLRTSPVGVINEHREVIHVAPPHFMVNELIIQLFDWLRTSKTHILIKSCIFHYEFEFIHPFLDGNGRMGRLWQTALLAKWKPIFEWIPIESVIRDHQEEYYRVISLSTSEGKSNQFILFMLSMIKASIEEIVSDTRNHFNHINNQIFALMSVIESYPMSAMELMEKLGLKSRNGFRQNYLIPALEAGIIGMTCPDKPTSKNQRYFKI